MAWVVSCDEYQHAHWNEADARSHLESIEEMGACKLPHTITRRFVRIGQLGLPEMLIG